MVGMKNILRIMRTDFDKVFALSFFFNNLIHSEV
jgi:hypothetical protein